jgi:hypothetical protein
MKKKTPKPKPVLNLEVIQALYEYGGLNVYRVMYFNEAICKVTCLINTFNFDFANETVKMLIKQGTRAFIEDLLVKFDGAYTGK